MVVEPTTSMMQKFSKNSEVMCALLKSWWESHDANLFWNNIHLNMFSFFAASTVTSRSTLWCSPSRNSHHRHHHFLGVSQTYPFCPLVIGRRFTSQERFQRKGILQHLHSFLGFVPWCGTKQRIWEGFACFGQNFSARPRRFNVDISRPKKGEDMEKMLLLLNFGWIWLDVFHINWLARFLNIHQPRME